MVSAAIMGLATMIGPEILETLGIERLSRGEAAGEGMLRKLFAGVVGGGEQAAARGVVQAEQVATKGAI